MASVDPTLSSWPEDAPVTEAEMSACAATLAKLYSKDKHYILFGSAHCRLLRKSIGPFARKMQANMFQGKGRSEYEQKQFIRQQKQAQIAQRKAQDQAHLNNTKLRLNRIEMLAALTQQQDSTLPRVLDGFVTETPQDPLLLSNTASTASATSATVATATTHPQKSPGIQLSDARACYVCKARYKDLHEFYHSLCPTCATLNWQKRQQTCNLIGRVALVTGARVKIGFCVALKLLRWGATVVVTTRFPTDCAKRYAAQVDYEQWRSRLHVYGLDFRDLKRVEHFCTNFESFHGRIDIIINNACQTIRRPAAYYAPLIKHETLQEGLHEQVRDVLRCNRTFVTLSSTCTFPATVLLDENVEHVAMNTVKAETQAETPGTTTPSSSISNDPVNTLSSSLASPAAAATATSAAAAAATTTPSVNQSQLNVHSEDGDIHLQRECLPTGATDVNGQQLDLRKRNTWVMKMEEIETSELAEVFAINSMAPFIINSRLTPLMKKSNAEEQDEKQHHHHYHHHHHNSDPCRKFIVNVSAMEGKFYRIKSSYHPHTNMAKAALNMMTRTSAEDLSKYDIYMTAVDTGWISDENPVEKAAKYAKNHHFQTPLDEIDAAARILDPVCCGLNDSNVTPKFGIFIKDYFQTEW